MVDIEHQPFCIPGSVAITVRGTVPKANCKKSYSLELAAHINLLPGTVVNCHAMSRASSLSVILVSTTNTKIWIR